MASATGTEAFRAGAQNAPQPGPAQPWDAGIEALGANDVIGTHGDRLAHGVETGPSVTSIAVGVVFGLGVWCLIGYVGFELYEYLA